MPSGYQPSDPPHEIPAKKQQLIELLQKLGFDGPVWLRKSPRKPRYARFSIHDKGDVYSQLHIRMDNMNPEFVMKHITEHNNELRDRLLKEFHQFMMEKLQ